MGVLDATDGGGMGMLRPTGGRVGWDCYALPAAEGWECYALPVAGWDGIATLYLRRMDGNVTPYRRQGGFLKRYELKVFSPTPKSASPSNVYFEEWCPVFRALGTD